MKAYLVGFSSRDTKDLSWIEIYMSTAPDILKKYGGKVLLIGKPEKIISDKSSPFNIIWGSNKC